MVSVKISTDQTLYISIRYTLDKWMSLLSQMFLLSQIKGI